MNPITNKAIDKEEAPTFVDAASIAKRYKITTRYVLQMAAEGRLPHLRLGKKCIRFSLQAVAEVLEGGAQ